MNKLTVLPRGFGAFPVLEVLDLTYNNLSEKSLPGNFFCLSKFKRNYFLTHLPKRYQTDAYICIFKQKQNKKQINKL